MQQQDNHVQAYEKHKWHQCHNLAQAIELRYGQLLHIHMCIVLRFHQFRQFASEVLLDSLTVYMYAQASILDICWCVRAYAQRLTVDAVSDYPSGGPAHSCAIKVTIDVSTWLGEVGGDPL